MDELDTNRYQKYRYRKYLVRYGTVRFGTDTDRYLNAKTGTKNPKCQYRKYFGPGNSILVRNRI
ncbi:hypothetical protein Hanom_Chr15g01378061 [Helianthus anomalus]